MVCDFDACFISTFVMMKHITCLTVEVDRALPFELMSGEVSVVWGRYIVVGQWILHLIGVWTDSFTDERKVLFVHQVASKALEWEAVLWSHCWIWLMSLPFITTINNYTKYYFDSFLQIQMGAAIEDTEDQSRWRVIVGEANSLLGHIWPWE